MARGPNNQANQLFNQSQGVANTAENNTNTLFNTLFPLYEGEATNPQGFGANDLAAMNTASQQSTGGAVSGAVGAGDLEAARTHNSGSFQAAGDEAAREGMRQNSENAVNIQGENAKLKQTQQQAGLAGMAGLEGQSQNELLASMGLGDQDVNTEINAGQSGWLQNFMKLISTFSQGTQGAGTLLSGAADAGFFA